MPARVEHGHGHRVALPFTRCLQRCYEYNFTRVSPGNRPAGMLAYHSSEVHYLFGSMTPADEYEATDYGVQQVMQHAWAEFARTGVPKNPDGTSWPRANETQPQLVQIDEPIRGMPVPVSTVTRLINEARAGVTAQQTSSPV